MDKNGWKWSWRRVYRLWGAKQKSMKSWLSNYNVTSFLGLHAACSLKVLTTSMPWGVCLKNAVVSFSRPFAGWWWWWGIGMKGRAKCVGLGLGENQALGQATWCSAEWEQAYYCLCGLEENSPVSLGRWIFLKMGWPNLPGMVCFVVCSGCPNKIP